VTTAAASRWDHVGLSDFGGVASRGELAARGIGADHVAGQVAARRWRVIGNAVLLHNSTPSRGQYQRLVLINCGPRAVLTSFTAAQAWGLTGWERDQVHVLAPAGTRRPRLPGLVLHRTGNWTGAEVARISRRHRLAPALVLAASSFASSRPGCGILAAAVQQQLTTAPELSAALRAAPRARHRAALIAAVGDIGQGAQALSEIDFARLCRRHRLPRPTRQAVRVEPSGRRRYLDVEWLLPDGRVVAAEIDGALHLAPRRWYDDALRQNEVVIGGTVVLRFPSVVVRNAPDLVADQLRRLFLAGPRRRS
jgi:hypothetical protein